MLNSDNDYSFLVMRPILKHCVHNIYTQTQNNAVGRWFLKSLFRVIFF